MSRDHFGGGAGYGSGSQAERPAKSLRKRVSNWLMISGVLALVAYGGFVAAGEPHGPSRFFDLVVYHVPIAAAVVICALNAYGDRSRRMTWAVVGAGLFAWLLADLYDYLYLRGLQQIPYPSLADLGYLLALPCLFVGIRLTSRRRSHVISRASWLDGAIAALAFASVGAAVLAPALTGLTHGDPTVVATNLAYPVGDLLLLSYLVGAMTLARGHGSAPLMALGVGLVIWTGADALYLYLVATDAYSGGWIDLAWPAGALAIAAAAMFSPASTPSLGQASQTSVVIPAIAALASVFVLMLDHWSRASGAAIVLGGVTLVMVALRLSLSTAENHRLVSKLRRDAVIDPLTGLDNRRKLYAKLDAAMDTEGGVYLALFDLDGFKAYNDAFGHTVGDSLLRALGLRLREAALRVGGAYRLGGDEFCVLIDHPGVDIETATENLRASLSEHGEHFSIGASCGVVELGVEATTANDAMRMADERMYLEKGGRARTSREWEAQDLLLSVLRERAPHLEDHVEGVGAHARAIAEELGCTKREIETIARAALFHDIGKVAVPDSILGKRGPLNDEEWGVMRDHTLIGQRILDSVTSLREAGALVRSSHERWDGGGYPDGLAGAEIPLGSRIIFVCDAFDAITEDRPYQQPRSPAEALEEVRRSVGSQFDPQVVEGFIAHFKASSKARPEAPVVAAPR